MTQPISKPKITNEFLAAISKRTCGRCKGKRTLRWDYDGGQVRCRICGDYPDGWGDRGISSTSSSVEEHGIRGQTASSRGNSGQVGMPVGRNEAEVKPEPRTATIEAVDPREGYRMEVSVNLWAHFMTWGLASRPKKCTWPECKKRIHRFTHCVRHMAAYIREFNATPILWSEMCLWHDGGEVTVKWVKDRAKLTRENRDSFRVQVTSVGVPRNAPSYAFGAWTQAREAFNDAMEYRVIGFNDALKQALNERDMRGVERESW